MSRTGTRAPATAAPKPVAVSSWIPRRAHDDQKPLWKALGVHWHGYTERGPGPNFPPQARRRRLTATPSVLLASPEDLAKWIMRAVRPQRGLLSVWSRNSRRFEVAARIGDVARIRHVAIAETIDGRSLYLAYPAPGRDRTLSIEAVTGVECPIGRCPLSCPLPRPPRSGVAAR